MTAKPIETRYDGRRFRSRLEARWAVYFNTLGITYEYEHQGYESRGTRYLPDFFLPGVGLRSMPPGVCVEVKPAHPSDREVMKCAVCPVPLVLVIGEPPGYQEEGAHQIVPPWDNFMRLVRCESCGNYKWEFMESNYYYCECGGRCSDGEDLFRDPMFESARIAALSARFEFDR